MLTQWANMRLPATEKHTESLYMVSLKSTFSHRENSHCEVLGVPLDSRHEFQAKRFIGCQATIWRCSPKGKGLRRMHELHCHVLESEWAHTFPRRRSHIIFIFLNLKIVESVSMCFWVVLSHIWNLKAFLKPCEKLCCCFISSSYHCHFDYLFETLMWQMQKHWLAHGHLFSTI